MSVAPYPKLIGFVYNPTNPKARDFVISLVDILDLQDKSWIATAGDVELSPERLSDTSVVLTAGGDGTILRVARKVASYRIPILAINMGRVGFITELDVTNAARLIPEYLEGPTRVENRMMLKATLLAENDQGKSLELHALNDVVLTRGSLPRLLDIDTHIDGELLTTYRADGVIVATPTGSTGYSLSAGGPILYPEAKEFIVQPLAAHMSFQTSVVVSQDSKVQLKLKTGKSAILSVDGSTEFVKVGQTVLIEKSPYFASFLRKNTPAEFFSTLTQGLGIKGRKVPPPRTNGI